VRAYSLRIVSSLVLDRTGLLRRDYAEHQDQGRRGDRTGVSTASEAVDLELSASFGLQAHRDNRINPA